MLEYIFEGNLNQKNLEETVTMSWFSKENVTSNTHLLDQRQHKPQTDYKENVSIKIDLVGLFTEDYLMKYKGFNYYTLCDPYYFTFRFCVPYTSTY